MKGVKIRDRDMIGEVVQMEYKHIYEHGEERISKRYLVRQTGSWYQNWYDEDMLESVLELSDTYAAKVYDLLIDVNLMVGNFDMIKMLVEEKQKYIK